MLKIDYLISVKHIFTWWDIFRTWWAYHDHYLFTSFATTETWVKLFKFRPSNVL